MDSCSGVINSSHKAKGEITLRIIRERSTQEVPCYCTSNLLFPNSNENSSTIDSIYSQQQIAYSQYNISKTFSDGKCIVYNTLHDSVVLLEPQEAAIFFDIDNSHKDQLYFKEWCRLGLLTFAPEMERLMIELQQANLKSPYGKIPTITLLPTQACNARCEYCFADHNKKITMSKETIDNTVRYFSRTFQAGDHVLLRWFGGEPLLGKNIIDSILGGVNEAFDGSLVYESVIITNGALLTDEIIQNAKEKWHLKKVQITIDGYQDYHNRRKNFINSNKNYYEKVINDIYALLSHHISVDCRINLDKDNIKQLDQIMNDLICFRDNPLFRARVTFLRPSDCGVNKIDYITPDDLYWAYSLIYQKLLEYGFVKDAIAFLPRRLMDSCILVNFNKLIIGADGNLYKCLQQILSPINSVGTTKDGVAPEQFLTHCRLAGVHEICNQCPYIPICGGGCEAYWELSKTEDITPCIREKYLMDLILELLYRQEESKCLI